MAGWEREGWAMGAAPPGGELPLSGLQIVKKERAIDNAAQRLAATAFPLEAAMKAGEGVLSLCSP